MARQHGYFILIPAFIPVDKKNLENQIAAMKALSAASQRRDLSEIMALEGIRYHAARDRDGNAKDMHHRWGTCEVEVPAEAEAEFQNDGTRQEIQEGESGPVFATVEGDPDAEQASVEVDPEPDAEPTTHGRRGRAKAA